jgi:hypothetical protein
MIIIKKRKAGLKATQKWFSNEINGFDSLSITIYKQVDFEIQTSGFFHTELFYTLHSDLTLTEEDIIKKYSSRFRTDIRRSEREGCVFNPSESKENFISIYNDFAKQRGINGLSIDKLTELNGNLILTSTSINGVIIAVHSYLVDNNLKKVRLLHTGNQRFCKELDQNMIARCNKFLHYMDMIKFKQDGFQVYDWGGITLHTQDIGLQGINRFKESFGGELIKQKELYSPLYYLILKLFK